MSKYRLRAANTYSSGEIAYFLCFPPRISWVSITKYCRDRWEAVTTLTSKGIAIVHYKGQQQLQEWIWKNEQYFFFFFFGSNEPVHINRPYKWEARAVYWKVVTRGWWTVQLCMQPRFVPPADGIGHNILLWMPKARREVAVKVKPAAVRKAHNGNQRAKGQQSFNSCCDERWWQVASPWDQSSYGIRSFDIKLSLMFRFFFFSCHVIFVIWFLMQKVVGKLLVSWRIEYTYKRKHQGSQGGIQDVNILQKNQSWN